MSVINNKIERNNKSDDALINEKIRAKEVRLIGSDGTQLGIMPARDAQHKAYEEELDLVCISPNAEPPVCKIMNYSKFKYEQQKREKEAKKNQKQIQVKEIRISPVIDKHDFDTKLKHARKFIESGDKVKVSIKFSGRMIANNELGRQQLIKFGEGCQDIASVEKAPKMEGRTMDMILTPIKK